MSQDRPTAPELLQAVREWLQGELLQEARGGRAFQLRVAIHALSVVERELSLQAALDVEERLRLVSLLGQDGDLLALNRELCARIRDGRIAAADEALRLHLRATTRDKLRVANPKYK